MASTRPLGVARVARDRVHPHVSEEELNALLTEELTRRAAGNIGMAGVPVVANAGRTAIHKALNDALTDEFEEVCF